MLYSYSPQVANEMHVYKLCYNCYSYSYTACMRVAIALFIAVTHIRTGIQSISDQSLT